MQPREALQSLLRVKAVIDHLKTIEQDSLTNQERAVLCECLERAHDQAESLLTPQIMQGLVQGRTEEKGDVDAAAGLLDA